MIERILDLCRLRRAVRSIQAWMPPPDVTTYVAFRRLGGPLLVVLDTPRAYLLIPGPWLDLDRAETHTRLYEFAAQLLEPDPDAPLATVTQAGLHFQAAVERCGRGRIRRPGPMTPMEDPREEDRSC